MDITSPKWFVDMVQALDGFATPRWRQKLQFALRPLDYMDTAAERFGDIFCAPVFGNYPVIVFLSHPLALQQLFTSDPNQISAPLNPLLRPIVGDRSIFCLEGGRHLRERKLLMPPFHRERMSQYGQLVCELTKNALHRLPTRESFSARELMQDISLDVILKVVFGLQDRQRFDAIKRPIGQFTDALQSPLLSSALFFPGLRRDWGRMTPWGNFRFLQRQIRELLAGEIGDRRQCPSNGKTDILSLLMDTRDEAGNPLSDEELVDELITMLLAGHETTATATAWALYWVHRDAAVRDKLLNELHSLGDDADPMAIAQLPYLTAVCNEALRIYPVAVLTVPREVKVPIEIMGYELSPGTRLYGSIYLTHRRSDIYSEPDTFKPERFLERQYSMYEFLPFGGGVRRCIGEALAQFEMKLVLSTMLTRYRFSLADTTPEYPQRRGVTMAPARGVRLAIQTIV